MPQTEIPVQVAIVDDDPAFGRMLCDYLGQHGLAARAYTDPEELLRGFDGGSLQLVIIDQVLGTTIGLEVLRRIRATSNVPCIILTGLSDDIDRVVGLESGADDYISKAASPREVLARIRAVLRRAAQQPATASAPPGTSRQAGWQFLHRRRELRRPDGSLVPLTTAEFELLRLLDERAGEPVSRDELYVKVLHRPFRPEDRSIDNLVAKLRRKIDEPEQLSRIRAVRPLGYMFTGFDGEPAEAPAQG